MLPLLCPRATLASDHDAVRTLLAVWLLHGLLMLLELLM